MKIVISEIESDVTWRVNEISTIRTLVYRYSLKENDEKLIIRSSIPMLYAIWEGYMVKVFTVLSGFINRSYTNWGDVNENISAFAFNEKIKDLSISASLVKKRKKVSDLRDFMLGNVDFSFNAPTKSNINLEVANNILAIFNIPEIDKRYKNRVNKLLKFRNSIAHGDNSYPADKLLIEEFSFLIIDLIYEVYLKIEFHVSNGCTEYRN